MKLLLAASLQAGISLVTPAPGAADGNRDVAIVLKSKGNVRVTRKNSRATILAKRGTRLHSGNLLRTGDQSLAALVFTDDKSILKVRSNSKVAIKGERQEHGILKTIALEFGQLWAKVTKTKTPFRVETPSGVAAVKGTIIYCFFDDTGLMKTICLDGLVDMSNDFGRTLVRAGETGIIRPNEAPVSRPSDPDEIPTWGTDDDAGGLIEIDFQDENGRTKKLKVRYE